jgi:ABC-type lipoprotein export system ATPase subunit
MMGSLSATGLSYSLAGRRLIDKVDLQVQPGERLAITGPSGVGKTTLLMLLSGLLRPHSGRVLLGEQPLENATEAIRQQVAIVFQGYGLLSLLSAAENVEVPLYARGIHARESGEMAMDALRRVGLAPWANHLTEELSGGQQQRVAIARALAMRPQLLLADEPTAEQDPEHRTLALEALLAEGQRGAVIVLATHDPEIAARCDRELRLSDGGLS